jgi:hypothetical protein
MIEWVPINEFEFVDGKPYLILYKDDSSGYRVGLYPKVPLIDRYFYAQNKITHAAYVNFPVEKTLEEKFEEFFEKHNVSPLEARTSTCLELLANIAKEHYEGKE